MLFGQICIEQGFCYESDLLKALNLQSNGDNRKIGEILVSMGSMNVDSVDKAVGLQKEYTLSPFD